MFKSLRWRLQVWHAFVLLAVIASFGGIVHRLHWQTRLQQVDKELDRAVGQVLSQLRRLIPWPTRPRPRPEENKPIVETDVASNRDRNGGVETNLNSDSAVVSNSEDGTGKPDSPTDVQRQPRDRSARDRQPGDRPPGDRPQRDRPPRDPGPLPEEFVNLFHGEEVSRLYFVIWGNKGEVLQKSESAPEIDFPSLKVDANGLPKTEFRERRADVVYREVIHVGMFNMNVLVGRSIERDIAAYHQSGLKLIVTGLIVLAAGMLGGGWLSARAIRPITDMTAAAESISALNLSERINVKETDSELGKLAVVLNGTFDRLQAAFERQSQFTADASHELRTPLSVISTHTELALARPRSNEEYRTAIETCQRASQKMKSLIDALLLLARFESGNSSLSHSRLDLESLVRDCVELVQPLASERKIRIESVTSATQVTGDWNRISQVVTNLLTNSIRYNVEGGSVRISTRSDNSDAIIKVTDTGIGMAESELPHIFDRFYQIDKARSRTEGSCGLGLSICKTIVEAHGGTITATSEPNVGTTIEVRLPLSAGDQPSGKVASLDERSVPVLSES